MTRVNTKSLEAMKQLANCIRALTIDAVEKAKSGHPGMPLGMADVATVLFAEFLKFVPQYPSWPNRDRFILSAGHGSMLLYSLLYLTGYPDISLDDLKQFRQLGSKTAGHPEHHLLSGIETTTGPLGQGLANAVGMAIARTIGASKLADPSMLDHKVYTIVGDGCLMEGISHEACSLAGHLKLKNFIVLYDSNNITIDGSRSLADSENVATRFKAYGWHTREINGHNFEEIRRALHEASTFNDGPCIIICRTTIALGAPTKANTCAAHGAPLGESEAKQAKKSYGWPEDKTFFIPDDLFAIWRNEIGQRSVPDYENWQKLAQQKDCDGADYTNLSDLKAFYESAKNPEATRESSGKVLSELIKHFPLIGGSADLTESNYTKTAGMTDITPNNFNGNYIHYGVREHAMGAIMNGIALYGGFVPYSGGFLVFMDYAKPALRMAALMQLQVIYVMTHDSIGVGEDGPTHQPIEQLAYLRSVPNVKVFRPADGIETAECWELALKNSSGPSVLCLTRQKVPQVRANVQDIPEEVRDARFDLSGECAERTQEYVSTRDHEKSKMGSLKSEGYNFCARGAYIISESSDTPRITIFATGSEVSIALEAQKQLHAQNISTRVISVPCFEIFDQQDDEYKQSILDNASVKIAIEAAVRFGWDKYIGRDGIFIGMNGFGVSAPSGQLFKLFGITAENLVKVALAAALH